MGDFKQSRTKVPNLTVSGDLTVEGDTTTISTTNTVVKDKLIELNNGATSNTKDCGIIIERGDTGDNAIFAWDESADSFIVGTTTATGASTDANLTITPTALNTGDITVGSGAAADTKIVFDGNAQDYRIGIDNGDAKLEIGHGTAHGTNTAIAIDSSGQVTKLSLAAAAVAVAADHIVILDGGATGAPKAESIQDLLSAIAGAGISVSGNQLVADGGGTADAVAADNISAGDAAINITTSSGNITIDAAANNTDIIFKGTDATSDITMLTLDGSEAGTATFNSAVVVGADLTIPGNIVHAGDTNNTIGFGTDTQDFQTGGSSRLDISDSGVRLGGANARVTTILDEDAMGTDSATALATQQSIKAYVDANKADMSFVLEDGDGTEVAITKDKEVKFVEGGGIDIDWTDVDNGTDGDPYDLTFTINAAQTGINSILATDLIVGEDAETAIDFGTVNEIDFKAANAVQLTLSDGVFRPQTDSDVDLGTSSLFFKDAFIDKITTTGDIELGHATDTTIARASAGQITVEGVAVLLAGAQTGITTDFNAGRKVGRDAHNLIDFSTDDKVTFRVANVDEVALEANELSPATSDGIALGSGTKMWSDLFLASGGVVNFNNGDMTLTHSANTLTAAGGTVATAALTTSTIVASGIVKTDNTTDATSTTDGSLQTDGGLSVALDAVVGNDLILLSDASVVHFGENKDVTLTHVHDTGLILNSSRQIQFGDAATHIKQVSDSNLEVEADGSIILDTPVVSFEDDGTILKFGADSEVTLTHVHDTGLLLSDASGVGTTKLMFGDAACFIQQQADGQLGIDADSIINITAPTLDIDASTAVTMTTPSLVVESATGEKPLVVIKNTANDVDGAILRFVKDKGAAGAADDFNGRIQFFGDDAAQDQVKFSEITSQVKVHTNGQEGGKLSFFVAENDGTATAGLIIEDGNADGELDVSIGAGLASVTAVSGGLQVNGPLIAVMPNVHNFTGDDANATIPVTTASAQIDANGSPRTGMRFASAGTAGQILVVINTGAEKVVFDATEGTALLRGTNVNKDTILPGEAHIFVSDGSLWNHVGGGKTDEGLTG